ncbi:hypothetical protein J4212_01270 [Candidatus Woesearchaeota archaeon]|nr:hypothetical protein [Candidatus Woesearchaeota archaeon]
MASDGILYFKYFLFFLMGLIVGRISMAIQYAIFKEMAFSKKKKNSEQDNKEIKVNQQRSL